MDTHGMCTMYNYGIGMCMYVLYVCQMSHRDMGIAIQIQIANSNWGRELL